jgi:hypothetical protein
MPHLQLVVVQPTPFCNIDCRYCYLPDRGNKAVLAEETIANLFSQVFESGWLQHGFGMPASRWCCRSISTGGRSG